jgi:hypothetical protein
MKRLGLVLVLVFSIGACGKSGGGSELEALKKKACACKEGDAKCLAEVGEQMDKLEDKFKDKKPSESEMKLGEEIAECMAKAMGADSK